MSLITDALKAAKAALKAEAHTAARGTEAASILTKKAKEVPPPSPRAKPKTKQEISEIAERVAPQLQGEFVRGAKGTTNVAGKSRKQFDLEQQLEHDLRRSREVPEAQPVDLSERKGSVMLSLPGDFTIADQDLFRVGDVQLREPSRQYGGPRYGLGHPEEAGWASGLSAAGKFQRGVTEASQQYGDAPVLANYMMMGPEGINYALHFADANLKAIDTTKMTKRNIRDFNSIIRKGHPKMKFPEFAGIENPDLAYEQMAADPELRKHFNAIMQMPTVSEAFKMPSGLNIRHAVTEPELRNLERGMTGFSLMEMEPGVASLKVSKHPTYSHDIPGTFLGKTDVPIPYELTFPDTVAQIRENPRQAPYEFGTLQFSGGRQMIDQQLIDEIGEYRRRIKELTGKKAGGLAMADGGQAFPLQPEFEAEVDRLRSRPRTRAGVPVEDTNVLGGALQGLANMLGGAAFGRLVGTAGLPADILEPMAAPGATIPMFGMAAMPTEISKALVQRFAPKGPDIPVPTSEFLLEKGLEKLKPAQEFEVAAKLGRYAPFDIAEMQAAGRKLKALQPALGELLEAQMKPYQMGVAPEGKLSKEEYSRMMREKYAAQNLAQQEKKATAADLKPQEVKVPADDLGFYSPAEKAAANLKRNIGTGEAFLQDIKKAPDVSPDELEFTGLERWLKGKKTVSKQEIQDYMSKNRLQLEEVEYKQGTGDVDEMRFPREGEVLDDYDYVQARADDYVYDWDSIGWKSKDEIREEILSRYDADEAEGLIASGRIDEMVDDEVRDLAYQSASDEYYENPYRRWSNDTGYEIVGNDDVGYSITDPRGNSITPSRGVYDFETAEGYAREHAMEYGFIDEGETKYHDYQLPGGENYREILIKSPSTGKEEIYQEMQRLERAMDNASDQREYNELKAERDAIADKHDITPEDYEGSHWDEPNVLAHLRVQDRVDAEGNKILYVDEMQSDWHQEGRRHGYKSGESKVKAEEALAKRDAKQAEVNEIWRKRQERNKELAKEFADTTDSEIKSMGSMQYAEKDPLLNQLDEAYNKVSRELTALQKEYGKYKDMVPSGPFTDNWHKMALKRIMKYAADNGYSRVGFSKAQPQVNRWGTDVVAWDKVPDGGWMVTATEQRGGRAGQIDLEADARARGILQESRPTEINTRDELYATVAKIGRGKSEEELQKLTDRVWKQMQEKDAGVVAPREAGMKKFYDEELEGSLKKYANQYKGKYGQTKLRVPGEGEQVINYIDITPEVKKSTTKGQPYKVGGAVHPAVDKFASSLPHPAVDKFVKRMAQGGAVYNTIPDTSDAEKMIQGPAF